MINILKKIGKVLLIVFLFLILFLLSVFVYNRIMLAKEAPLLNQPIGTMVEVDGHSMCVYTEGEGDHTIVFLSGSGTAAPILDFKSLYSLLSDEVKTMDELIEGSGLAPAALAELLLEMELDDLIVRVGNNAFRRKR